MYLLGTRIPTNQAFFLNGACMVGKIGTYKRLLIAACPVLYMYSFNINRTI